MSKEMTSAERKAAAQQEYWDEVDAKYYRLKTMEARRAPSFWDRNPWAGPLCWLGGFLVLGAAYITGLLLLARSV